MSDRKKLLDDFIKQMKEGIPFSEDFIEGDKDVYNNALLARNLEEDALAREVLKNTGVPIPTGNVSTSKKEDFLNRIIAERYPEIKDPGIKIGNESYYQRGKGSFVKDSSDVHDLVGTALHENAHNFDDSILGYESKALDKGALRAAKYGGMDLKTADPTQVYEMLGKGHHAEIPKLREGTFGYGALKSLIKNGTFKSIAGPGLGVGLAAATMSDDASASDFIPGLDQASPAGSAMDDKMMQTEVKARQNYDASQARKDALNKLSNK